MFKVLLVSALIQLADRKEHASVTLIREGDGGNGEGNGDEWVVSLCQNLDGSWFAQLSFWAAHVDGPIPYKGATYNTREGAALSATSLLEKKTPWGYMQRYGVPFSSLEPLCCKGHANV
jgi:hypothetical protein